jgi:hypothetical protein
MPFLTASALNDNAEGLDFLRAVLSDSRSQRHSPRAPSWTPSAAYLGGEVCLRHRLGKAADLASSTDPWGHHSAARSVHARC